MGRLRKIIAAAMCFLIVAMLPVSVSAETREEQLLNTISDLYWRTMAANGVSDMFGLCGRFAAYQLYYLGVEQYPVPFDGKNGYDMYCDKEVSSGGYQITAYSAADYSLEEILNRITKNGTRDAYNILVGFQWTNTESGANYGHAVVIHAILDGIVYSVETFHSLLGGPAGHPFGCTIAEYARSYDSWTKLDGVIYFGKKPYVDSCQAYGTDLFVRAETDTPLLDQPWDPETEGEDVETLRVISAGERLRVTGLYENTEHRMYYRVLEADAAGYVDAGDAEQVRINLEGVTLSELQAPEAVAKGEDFALAGVVSSGDSALKAARVAVLDGNGRHVLEGSLEGDGHTCDLGDGELNQTMDFSALPEGNYTYQIYGDVVNYAFEDGAVTSAEDSVLLYEAPFRVLEGETEAPVTVLKPMEPENIVSASDGWSWDGQTWYYYEDGKPRTGWFRDQGISYFLQDDGSATTGWACINGQDRYFTDTGAMRTGWLRSEDGDYYLLSNGAVAKRWREIDGDRYFFDGDTGIMTVKSWLTWEDARYYLMPDGKAATGWLTLEDGRFCFRQDGRLLAQSVERDGQTYIQAANFAN